MSPPPPTMMELYHIHVFLFLLNIKNSLSDSLILDVLTLTYQGLNRMSSSPVFPEELVSSQERREV